jgi:hypothetical protein
MQLYAAAQYSDWCQMQGNGETSLSNCMHQNTVLTFIFQLCTMSSKWTIPTWLPMINFYVHTFHRIRSLLVRDFFYQQWWILQCWLATNSGTTSTAFCLRYRSDIPVIFRVSIYTWKSNTKSVSLATNHKFPPFHRTRIFNTPPHSQETAVRTCSEQAVSSVYSPYVHNKPI